DALPIWGGGSASTPSLYSAQPAETLRLVRSLVDERVTLQKQADHDQRFPERHRWRGQSAVRVRTPLLPPRSNTSAGRRAKMPLQTSPATCTSPLKAFENRGARRSDRSPANRRFRRPPPIEESRPPRLASTSHPRAGDPLHGADDRGERRAPGSPDTALPRA